MLNRPAPRLALFGLVPAALVPLAGCQVVSNLPAPGRTAQITEPATGHDYCLYVPTSYHAEQPAALVVTCHGTKPWDTARQQIKEWRGLAEQKGFLVAAPELLGTKGDLPPKRPEQIRRQSDDERTLLGVVRAIRGSHAVNQDRIFLTGWSAGNYAVLYTGLRHPEVFRALSVRQGNFDPAYVERCVPFLDRYQPIQIMFGDLDPLDSSQAIVDWLRSHDLEPSTLERAGIHRRDPAPAYAFFADVVRRRPVVRARVREDPADALRIAFDVHTSFEAQRYLWDFGDAQQSAEPRPEHRYTQPGLYSVRVAAWAPNGKPYQRRFQLQVPRLRLGTGPNSAPAP